MFPGMPQRQWKCLMYYRRYLSQYISVPNVTIVFFSTIVHSVILCPIGNGRTGND